MQPMKKRCKVYEVSRKALRNEIQNRFSNCDSGFKSLKNKDSEYANSIAAMRDIYSEILSVIDGKSTA